MKHALVYTADRATLLAKLEPKRFESLKVHAHTPGEQYEDDNGDLHWEVEPEPLFNDDGTPLMEETSPYIGDGYIGTAMNTGTASFCVEVDDDGRECSRTDWPDFFERWISTGDGIAIQLPSQRWFPTMVR